MKTLITVNTRSIVMTAAHRIAKELIGDTYSQCLSKALKMAWAAIKTGCSGTVVPAYVVEAVKEIRTEKLFSNVKSLEKEDGVNIFIMLQEKHGVSYNYLNDSHVKELLSGTFTHPEQKVVNHFINKGDKLFAALGGNNEYPIYKEDSFGITTYYYAN